eukprot:GFKZ01009928.1.p1 GENE.GFKZ01009928.1~~GFKZ01009928.1.p1  ORF type:complete len:392 (+),score=77.89 GFKZ01009928.1:396-1571(+)
MSTPQTFEDDSPTGVQASNVAQPKDRKSSFLRGMSRKISSKVDAQGGTASTSNTKLTRGMSRKRSLCEKLARHSKMEPVFGSRCKTGPKTLAAKKRVLQKFGGLRIKAGMDKAEEFVLQGINSIRAETIDFYAMVVVMQDNVRMLTHTAVQRFFEWIPLFAIYLERYMLVEEDFIFKWAERKVESLRGSLKPSGRMVMQGKIQKGIRDVQETHDLFVPHLPPGERLPKLVAAADSFTALVEEYCTMVSEKLPGVVREQFDKGEIEKARMKLMKHVVGHIGYQDFVALYTRWMGAGELLEWKTSVLFPSDFRFFSYGTWDKDMEFAHYKIAAQFAEVLEDENLEAMELNKQSKADFDRALGMRQKMELPEELDEDDAVIEKVDAKEIGGEDM